MTKMTEIWITSTGDYSDYAVDCAFSTLDKAKAWTREKENAEKIEHSKWERKHVKDGNRPRGPVPYYSRWNAPMCVDFNPPLPSLVRSRSQK